MLNDTTPSEPKTLIEFKAKKTVKPAASLSATQDSVSAALNQQRNSGEPVTGAEGAAAAVGVLTAVDEDSEGAEEAVVPNEFEYHSDGYEEEG